MAEKVPVDLDDLESLDALASGKPPPTFDEAYAMLDNGTPREVAQDYYDKFVRYHHPGTATG